MTQILSTTHHVDPLPMPASVLTALREITDRTGEIDDDMFRADGRYIAYHGHDDGRMSLVEVPGDGLYARFDRRRYPRLEDRTPDTAIWEPVSEWPVTGCDPVGIARTMWRLTVEDAT